MFLSQLGSRFLEDSAPWIYAFLGLAFREKSACAFHAKCKGLQDSISSPFNRNLSSVNRRDRKEMPQAHWGTYK